MFVRVKKIKGKKYAYLVENEWTPWGSRQKVTKYLGKTHTITKYTENHTTLPAGLQFAITHAIIQELKNHGFTQDEHTLKQENITINLNDKTVKQNNKKAVLEMNEGYMCDHTIQQLLDYTPEGKHEENAKKLANLVLEAGLKLTNEQFIHIFEQVKNE